MRDTETQIPQKVHFLRNLVFAGMSISTYFLLSSLPAPLFAEALHRSSLPAPLFAEAKKKCPDNPDTFSFLFCCCP